MSGLLLAGMLAGFVVVSRYMGLLGDNIALQQKYLLQLQSAEREREQRIRELDAALRNVMSLETSTSARLDHAQSRLNDVQSDFLRSQQALQNAQSRLARTEAELMRTRQALAGGQTQPAGPINR